MAGDRYLIDVQSPISRQRAHGQFRLIGHAELAGDDHVQLCLQLAGDLGSHGNATTWDSQHERVLVTIPLQGRCQPLPSS